MAIFMADCQAVTLTLHKTGCPLLPSEHQETCGCGNSPGENNQLWICETHFNPQRVHAFMDRRYWSLVFCETCFSKNPAV
jgi:hypothetical protein